MSKKKNDIAGMVRRAKKSLGLNGENQQDLLRRARRELELTNAELAELLGVSLPTLYAYLAQPTAAKHRTMPDDSRLLLTRILAEHREGKGKRK